MTFPNRIGYRLRSREKSATALTVSDALGKATFDCAVKEKKPDLKSSTAWSAHDHALLPLTHRLMAMISQPAKLLAALVRDCSEPYRSASKQTFWARAMAFQHSELQGLCSAWCRVMEDIDTFELDATDIVLLKATLYYWRLWQHLCAACVDAVAAIEEAATTTTLRAPPPPLQQESLSPWATLPQKRPAASLSPSLEDKCSDALSQGMVLSGLSKRSRITKRSNEFLVAWFLAHKDNPYPSPDERSDIALKTGLAEQQVRNWFANMRKRHWKPNRSNAKKPRCLLDYVLRQTEA